MHVAVRVVLRHAADAGEPVHDAGLLVAVDGAELEQPQRQLAVGPPARPVDQVVHRAVHRLEVVVHAIIPNESKRIRQISNTYIALRYAPEPASIVLDNFTKEICVRFPCIGKERMAATKV